MLMNLAKYQWHLKETEQDIDGSTPSFESGGTFSAAFLRLCALRGIETTEQFMELTNQKPDLFHDPYLLHGMERAVQRIRDAIAQGENILIYGDYDADGVTSTLILYEALESLGANITYYLPHRVHDGYGPNKERWEQLAEEYGLDLIITCDNGVAGHEAISLMNSLNVDVIVTDHHEMQSTLPDAYAVIHPSHPAGDYPFTDLSGAGVALKVVSALLDEIPLEAMGLAAIGTVADMVSLTDENRTIVIHGINMMKQSPRLGLEMLLEKEKVNLDQIDTQTIGFIIGPRLNSVGRLGDPSPALELLRTFDDEEAQQLLTFVNEKNKERQQLTQLITEEVEERIQKYETLPDIIMEAHSNWPAGILGIVASRLVNKYQRPAILFQYQEEKEVYKGSARSVPAVNMFESLERLSDMLSNFGGHHQAAGLTVEKSQWQNFLAAMRSLMAEKHEQIIVPDELPIDMKLSASDITPKFVKELELLGPFGEGNHRPRFLVEDIEILQTRLIGANKDHVKFTMEENNVAVTALGFSKAEQCQGIVEGNKVSIAGILSLNEWNGKVTAQILLDDIGVKGSQWLDYRGSQIHSDLWQVDSALYVFAHESVRNHMSGQISNHNKSILFKEVVNHNELLQDNLVIMEPAPSLNQMKQLVEAHHWHKIYLGSFVNESLYAAGMPAREEFTALYKLLMNKKEINLREMLKPLSVQLNIRPVKLKVYFKMFLEAGFATIEHGRLIYKQINRDEKVSIKELKSYQTYKQAMEAEAFLNYQPLEKIKNYFEGN